MEPVFVARQPVFDERERVWGYELLFRSSQDSRGANVQDQDAATSQVIADGFELTRPTIAADRKVLINFPKNLLLSEAATLLPPEFCIVEILETVRPEPGVLRACRMLKDLGYQLALDDFVGDPGFEPLLELADIIKVDTLEMKPSTIIKVADSLRGYRATLLAEKVESKEIFKLCRDNGYELFQGFFFSKPELIKGRKLSSNKLSKLQILKELAGEDYEVRKVAKIINSDVSLSYRLLRYINSASFGLGNEVTSINQAITLLGQAHLAKWLRVVILSDLAGSPKAGELAYMSILRGRFLEILATRMPRAPYPPDTMFLLGLFSMLDALLGQPMDRLLEDLPLDESIKDALVGRSETEASSMLDLMNAYDRASWDDIHRFQDDFSLSAGLLAISRTEAMGWAKDVLSAQV